MEDYISNIGFDIEYPKIFMKMNHEASSIAHILKQVKPGIWIFKGFLDEKMQKLYRLGLDSMSEDEWNKYHSNYTPGDLSKTWYDNKISQDMVPAWGLYDKIFNFFAPEYANLKLNSFFYRLLPEDKTTIELGRHVVRINKNFGAKFKLGIYLGDWSGGEICFPEFDIKIKTEQGDMLFWKESYYHYIAPVTSGVRYSYSDYIVPALDTLIV